MDSCQVVWGFVRLLFGIDHCSRITHPYNPATIIRNLGDKMSLLLCVHIHSAFVVRVLHRWHPPTFFLYWRSKLPVLRLTHSATSFSGFLPLEQVADFANPSHLLGTGGIKKNTATVRLLLEVRVAIQVNRAKDSRMLVEIEEEKKEQTAYRCPLSNVGPSLRLLFEKHKETWGKRQAVHRCSDLASARGRFTWYVIVLMSHCDLLRLCAQFKHLWLNLSFVPAGLVVLMREIVIARTLPSVAALELLVFLLCPRNVLRQ